ncbi:replicative DNA helicase [Streptomyces sp. NPDC090231]|uniref:replicative DNA helicase n=1 Tax=unclassified Streptomyces TaxID=2593676 RepID=UPI002E123D70|nr:replicative DNA helicase [Streptomyces sp. NBC_01324]
MSNESDGRETPSSDDHAVSAEKTVLRAMLLSADTLADVVEMLHPRDFYEPAHVLIYEAVLRVYASGESPDPIRVTKVLDSDASLDAAGGRDYLDLLIARGSGDGWRRAAERVQAHAMLRRTKEAAARVESLASESKPEEADRLADIAQAEILAATAQRPRGLAPSYSIGDILEGALDQLEAVGSTGALSGVPTGFTDLDVLTSGLCPGHLTVVAARPAMGTSTFALDLLRSASIKHGLPAALFTYESGREEIATRILSAEARVSLLHMRAGTMDDEDWVRVARRVPDVAKAPLYIQDEAWPTFTDLRAQCRRLAGQRKIKLIIVDNLQMMTYGTRPLGSRYEEISEISRCLKLLASELQIPIVAISKANRGAEQRTDKKPMLSDLRDSGSLEDNADLVILLHREDAYEKESPRAGEADLIVAKHRNGPTATITVAFQGHYSRFVDMAQT